MEKGSWRVSDRVADTLVTGFDATVWVWRCCSIPSGSTLMRVGGLLTSRYEASETQSSGYLGDSSIDIAVLCQAHTQTMVFAVLHFETPSAGPVGSSRSLSRALGIQTNSSSCWCRLGCGVDYLRLVSGMPAFRRVAAGTPNSRHAVYLIPLRSE